MGSTYWSAISKLKHIQTAYIVRHCDNLSIHKNLINNFINKQYNIKSFSFQESKYKKKF